MWPLDPNGEIFVILQIEDTRGVDNLDAMLKKVQGIGAILIGEGDLGQELGYPAPVRAPGSCSKQMARVVETCKKHNVIVGHPHVEAGNCERILEGRLSLPDVRAGAQLRPSRQGARRRGIEVTRCRRIRNPARSRCRTNLADYAMTKALKTGAIKSDLVTFDFCGPKVANQGFKAMVRERAFDAGELAIGTFCEARTYGKPVALLPAVVMGRFQHGHALRATRAGRSRPARSRASASASAPTRRRPASGCAASSSTNTAST